MPASSSVAPLATFATTPTPTVEPLLTASRSVPAVTLRLLLAARRVEPCKSNVPSPDLVNPTAFETGPTSASESPGFATVTVETESNATGTAI